MAYEEHQTRFYVQGRDLTQQVASLKTKVSQLTSRLVVSTFKTESLIKKNIEEQVAKVTSLEAALQEKQSTYQILLKNKDDESFSKIRDAENELHQLRMKLQVTASEYDEQKQALDEVLEEN